MPSYTLALTGGWNMVSFKIIPDDPSVSLLFAGAPAGWQILTYNATGTAYIVPTTIVAGVGYYVFMIVPYTLTISGSTWVEYYERDVIAGWSFIGAIYGKTVQMIPDVLPVGTVYQLVWWDGFAYINETTIEPDKGYFFLLLDNRHIIVGVKPAQLSWTSCPRCGCISNLTRKGQVGSIMPKNEERRRRKRIVAFDSMIICGSCGHRWRTSKPTIFEAMGRDTPDDVPY